MLTFLRLPEQAVVRLCPGPLTHSPQSESSELPPVSCLGWVGDRLTGVGLINCPSHYHHIISHHISLTELSVCLLTGGY